MGKIDRDIAELAARQHGVVARRQLEALGISRQAVDWRARTGRLHRVHRGVYAVGQPRLTLHGHLLAAVLTIGPGGVASHISAAVLHRIWKGGQPRVHHVTVPGSAGRARRPGVVVHRSELGPGEAGLVDGIPVTSPARTVADLADVAPRRAVERAIDEAHHLGLDLSGLAPLHGKRGAGRLAAVLGEHDPGSTLTRSELEEWLLALCRRRRLPSPAVNAYVEGYEVDFSWPDKRLIVETDGRATHDTQIAFEKDRVRDAELVVAGWRVIRVTRRRLKRQAAAVESQLQSLLE